MLKKKNIFIINVFFLLSTIGIHAQDSDKSILLKDWQISFNQTMSIQIIEQDQSWQKIDLSTTIKAPFKKEGKIVYCWLRSSFFLDDVFDSYYGLSIQKLFMLDQTYINETCIGSLGEEEFHNFDMPRSYVIQRGILNKGLNRIYIRLGFFDEWGGEISKNIEIQTPTLFKITKLHFRLLFEYLPISILLLLIFIFISSLINFFFNYKNKEYVYSASRLLLVITGYLTIYPPFPLFSIKIIISIWYSLIPLFFITMLLFYQSVFNIYFTNRNRILITILIIIALLIFMRFNAFLNNILTLCTSIFFIVYLLYLNIRLNKIKPDKIKFIFIQTDLIIISINYVIISLFLITGIAFIDPSLLMLISSIFLAIFFTVYYSNRERIRKKRTEQLYEKLKLTVESKQKISITDTMQDKIDNTIEFIKQNYAEEITREDLAEAIGLNPNYFSTIFKAHTGTKLNDFITQQRIEQATNRLKQKDKNIIDIAFAVGFDSLPTFNRNFKKFMGVNPSEYRKRN